MTELHEPAVVAEPDARRGRAALGHTAALLGYLAGAALLWARMLRHLSTHTLGGDDAYLFTWWLRWTPFALLHGHLPLRTAWLGHPLGVNGMWNTSVFLLGAVMTPVTELAGPLVTFNVLSILSAPLSAFACYLVACRLFGRGWPAVVGGFLYGFSPYFIGQSAGHLQMSFALFPPALTWLLAEVVVFQRWPARRAGLALGVAVGLQLVVGEELLASSAFLAGLTLVLIALIHRRQVSARLPHVLRAACWAAGAAVVLDAVPLYVQFFGPQRVSGQVQTVAPGADLLSFVVPTPLQAWHVFGGSSLVHRVVGDNLSEQTAYLGIPAILLVLWALIGTRKTPRVLLGIPLLTAAVLALGRHLVVGGAATGVPLPADAIAHVPVLQSMLPVRFSQYVFLFTGLLVAGWLAQPASRPRRSLHLVVLAFAIAALVPIRLPAFPVSVPPFFTAGGAARLLPADSAAFVAPYPGPGHAGPMLWQADADMRFRMVGGYFVGPDRHGKALFGAPPGVFAQVVSGIGKGRHVPALDGPAAAAMKREAAADHLNEIIVGPMTHSSDLVHFLEALFHRRAVFDGDVWVVRISP